jgi:hypothetical protein
MTLRPHIAEHDSSASSECDPLYKVRGKCLQCRQLRNKQRPLWVSSSLSASYQLRPQVRTSRSSNTSSTVLKDTELPKFLILISLILAASAHGQEPSVCYGTTSNGRLENGWALPASGTNFSTHWTIGRLVGRSHVHSQVHPVVIDAYQQLETALPDRVFVYGETGWEEGGQFKPHKTHRNGLSVDFMVPVLDEYDQSVELPSSVLNK